MVAACSFTRPAAALAGEVPSRCSRRATHQKLAAHGISLEKALKGPTLGGLIDGGKAAGLGIVRDGEQQQHADHQADDARRPHAPPVHTQTRCLGSQSLTEAGCGSSYAGNSAGLMTPGVYSARCTATAAIFTTSVTPIIDRFDTHLQPKRLAAPPAMRGAAKPPMLLDAVQKPHQVPRSRVGNQAVRILSASQAARELPETTVAGARWHHTISFDWLLLQRSATTRNTMQAGDV